MLIQPAVTNPARLLGMNPTTLNSKIKTYNINLRP